MDLSFFSKTKALPGAPEAVKPEFSDLADWSFDFGGRFGLDNIISSITQWKSEQEIKKMIEDKQKARTQKLLHEKA